MKTNMYGVLVAASIAVLAGCNTVTAPEPPQNPVGSAPAPDDSAAFSNGGFSVSARTTRTPDATQTEVSAGGIALVEMSATLDGFTMSFPTAGGAANVVFRTPLDTLPSEFAANRLAVFVAGQLFGDADGIRPDNPGCDMFPDTRCTLRCCAEHDRCYARNNCSFLSWLTTSFVPFSPLFNACSNCNAVAARCIIAACATADEGDPNSDVCFDSACGANYTCPPPNQFDCFACPSPCAGAPATCGDGSCDLGETEENCVSDCATGAGVNTCCMENNNCASETETACPGGCCCCGLGETCGAGEICRPGDPTP